MNEDVRVGLARLMRSTASRAGVGVLNIARDAGRVSAGARYGPGSAAQVRWRVHCSAL